MRILQKRVLVPCRPQLSRAGEASAVVRKNGEILFAYSRFAAGGEDHDFSELRGGVLDLDSGVIAGEKTLFPCPEACNQMSVSLERLPDGDIGFVFGRKSSAHANELFFSRSCDEGENWSEPVSISGTFRKIAPYWVHNNDRLRVLSGGRLALPVCIYYDGFLPEKPGYGRQIESRMAVFFSDDGGAVWRLSRLVPDGGTYLQPHRCSPEGFARFAAASKHPYRFQEPGIEPLADGRVLFYCRSMLGYMYMCYSEDNAESFSELRAMPDLISPCSPQSIRRIPGSNRLCCVFNDRRNAAYGEENWEWRTPLNLAISDDNAASFQQLGEIEDDSHNYCYTSMTFISPDQLLLTEYESENLPNRRRNLATLKMQLAAL